MWVARAVILAAVFVGSPAGAAPRVPGSELATLPGGGAAFAEMEAKVQELASAFAAAKTEARTAQGNIKSRKLEVKATRAKLKADKAALKAAKKVNDPSRADDARTEIEATQAALERSSGTIALAKADAKVAAAQAVLLGAELDLHRAELELAKARAVDEAGGFIDVERFEEAVDAAAVHHEQARQRLEEAREARDAVEAT